MIKYLLILTFLSCYNSQADTKSHVASSPSSIVRNLPLEKDFYLHLKGKIGDKEAILDLIYTKNKGLIGFCSYAENPKPLFFMSKSNELNLEFHLLDHTFKKGIILKGDLYNNKFSGSFFGAEKENILGQFEFSQGEKGECIDFSLLSYSKELSLQRGLDDVESPNAFFKLVSPYSDSFYTLNEKIFTEVLKQEKYDNQLGFEANLKKQVEHFFIEDINNLQELPNENSYRDYTLSIAYNSNDIISLYLVKEFDIFRKQKCIGNGFSYSIKQRKRVLFNDIFKKNAKAKVKELIKSKFYSLNKRPTKKDIEKMESINDFRMETYNSFKKDIETYDFDNFLLSKEGITFVYFRYIDKRLCISSGQQYYFTYEEIINLIRKDAINFLIR